MTRLGFSPVHSEAHVPGRHLNGLLTAEEVLGVEVSEEAVRVGAPYSAGGLTVEAKRAGPLFVRIPPWVERDQVEVSGADGVMSDEYLFFARPPVGASIRVEFALQGQELTLSERLHIQSIRVRLRGDAVVAMEDLGAELTFFEPYG